MLNDVAAFETKLSLFALQLQEISFTHFSVLQSHMLQAGSFLPAPYCAYLAELKDPIRGR